MQDCIDIYTCTFIIVSLFEYELLHTKVLHFTAPLLRHIMQIQMSQDENEAQEQGGKFV